jgi:hypothetical protein
VNFHCRRTPCSSKRTTTFTVVALPPCSPRPTISVQPSVRSADASSSQRMLRIVS